jgi:hypothetical protein
LDRDEIGRIDVLLVGGRAEARQLSGDSPPLTLLVVPTEKSSLVDSKGRSTIDY